MEVVNDLLNYNSMKIIQDNEMFAFSLDSVLLPNFVTINKNISKILDIGCGNGPMPMILSTKTKANIIGVEIQPAVYNMAKRSIELNNLQEQIEIINDDINNYSKSIESDQFDIIICNPPFFKVEEGSNFNQSDYKTIARHEVKLDLEQLFKIGKKLLKNGGNIAIVHRPERFIEIIETMRQNNIEPKKVQFVYPKDNSVANTLLIEGVKNGNPGLKILEPIIAHNTDGNYSDAIKKIFEMR